MSVSVKIPTPLRKYTNNVAEVTAEAANIEELIENLESSYAGIKERLQDDSGAIRRFVNIYVNDVPVYCGFGMSICGWGKSAVLKGRV